MTALSVNNLRKAFGGVVAVDGVTFELAAGELLAMIGPNGAGKTTCFNMLHGQLKPDSGSIRYRNKELAGLPPRKIWRCGVGRTFQITATFGSMTVLENVQMALISHHGGLAGMVRPAAKMHAGEARDLLARVGMADQADRPCAVLAYGDLKRVELAVALANRPGLLLMDEPTAGMAPGERKELMALTAEIVRQSGLSVLFTEHDMDVVFAHADRIIVLNRGAIIAAGPPPAVRDNAQVRAVYLGDGECGGTELDGI